MPTSKEETSSSLASEKLPEGLLGGGGGQGRGLRIGTGQGGSRATWGEKAGQTTLCLLGQEQRYYISL